MKLADKLQHHLIAIIWKLNDLELDTLNTRIIFQWNAMITALVCSREQTNIHMKLNEKGERYMIMHSIWVIEWLQKSLIDFYIHRSFLHQKLMNFRMEFVLMCQCLCCWLYIWLDILHNKTRTFHRIYIVWSSHAIKSHIINT